MQQEIHSLVVHCTFVDVGCNWKGQLRYLQVILELELWFIDIFVRVLHRLMIGGGGGGRGQISAAGIFFAYMKSA